MSRMFGRVPLYVLLALTPAALVGCGGGGGDSGNGTPTTTTSATLTWSPPTQNTDGSPLTDLAGYRVYWGTSLDTYPNSVMLDNPGLTAYVVDNLQPATWYFAITAVNKKGVESPFSNVMSKTIQ